jgi:hypothetical protein
LRRPYAWPPSRSGCPVLGALSTLTTPAVPRQLAARWKIRTERENGSRGVACGDAAVAASRPDPGGHAPRVVRSRRDRGCRDLRALPQPERLHQLHRGRRAGRLRAVHRDACPLAERAEEAGIVRPRLGTRRSSRAPEWCSARAEVTWGRAAMRGAADAPCSRTARASPSAPSDACPRRPASRAGAHAGADPDSGSHVRECSSTAEPAPPRARASAARAARRRATSRRHPAALRRRGGCARGRRAGRAC